MSTTLGTGYVALIVARLRDYSKDLNVSGKTKIICLVFFCHFSTLVSVWQFKSLRLSRYNDKQLAISLNLIEIALAFVVLESPRYSQGW